jgi:hypothetical protein
MMQTDPFNKTKEEPKAEDIIAESTTTEFKIIQP